MDDELKEMKYKEWITVCIIVIVFCGLGIVFLSRTAKSELAIVSSENKDVVRQMVANVKGSIYGSGEIMSVFGTCVDMNYVPINTSAYFSAWYPNGTQFISNTSMTQLQIGYFLYTGPMSVQKGTYLTEMECVDESTGQTAKAMCMKWLN